MIVYIEKDILLDTQCRDLYLCDNDLNNEYLLISSIDQCSCKKQQVILCKSDHDVCENRCLTENRLFVKQKNQFNEIMIKNSLTNVVLLDKNQLENNSEMIFICHGDNLPKPIFEHLKNKFTATDNSILNQRLSQIFILDFLMKHSVLIQSIYGMYLTLHQARYNSFQLR
jgi:hypothetical protein